jgi:hypothetical protein
MVNGSSNVVLLSRLRNVDSDHHIHVISHQSLMLMQSACKPSFSLPSAALITTRPRSEAGRPAHGPRSDCWPGSKRIAGPVAAWRTGLSARHSRPPAHTRCGGPWDWPSRKAGSRQNRFRRNHCFRTGAVPRTRADPVRSSRCQLARRHRRKHLRRQNRSGRTSRTARPSLVAAGG